MVTAEVEWHLALAGHCGDSNSGSQSECGDCLE